MAFQKREIIISATLVLTLVVLFIIGSTKLISNGNSLGTTIGYSFMYFTICYLYINRISTMKWRILVVALSIIVIIITISLHFVIHPRSWDFQDRIIFGVDTVALAGFLVKNLTRDKRNIILLASFTGEVDLLFYNREDSRQLNQIFTVVVSNIVYVILTTFHVKQIWDRRLKVAAIMSIFGFTAVMGVIIRIYWYNTQMLFIISASINTCLSLVPWLWLMCAPKIKSWWQTYIGQEIIQDERYNFDEIAGLPTRLTIKELETTTSNFQASIGEGASGAVFKGTLEDGSIVAVKRIKWKPSGETEFRTEMSIIASRQHVNLVRLLGFCISPRGENYLIYPFLQNGSLDVWLFSDPNKRSRLSLALRYHIATDVAKALTYLHHECHHRILHLDIKPANILLDEDFRALLSDFGISKLIGKDESSVMTKARGTVGYLAPEMLVPDAISTKSDVYSYGMMLFELVGGRRKLMVVMDGKSKQRRRSYFPKIVREKMMQGELMEVVDESLMKNQEISEEQVTVLTRLALWCIQENPMLRPGMIEVVEMLEGRMAVDMPPESPMFVVNFLDEEPQYIVHFHSVRQMRSMCYETSFFPEIRFGYQFSPNLKLQIKKIKN